MLAFGAARAAEPGAAPASEKELTDRYLADIATEESRNGFFSAELYDLLLGLALTYQENGDHLYAVTVLERALQVKRANAGLHTIEQAPLLRQLMANEAALGLAGPAAERERRLLELARRNPDDLRSVPILREAGDRQLAAYEGRAALETPPANFTADSVWSTTHVLAGPPPGGREFALYSARRNYQDAIRNIFRNGDPRHEDLVPIEEDLTRTYYLEARDNNDRLWVSEIAHDLGHESYRRRVVYSALTSGGDAVELAKALVALADWQLLFSHNGAAVERYDEAYRTLLADGATETMVGEVFPPDVPVPLPTFVASPLATAGGADERPYADVEFAVTKYGKARDVHVVAAAGEGSEALARSAVRFVVANRFRPRPAGAALDADTPFRARYRALPRAAEPTRTDHPGS